MSSAREPPRLSFSQTEISTQQLALRACSARALGRVFAGSRFPPSLPALGTRTLALGRAARGASARVNRPPDSGAWGRKQWGPWQCAGAGGVAQQLHVVSRDGGRGCGCDSATVDPMLPLDSLRFLDASGLRMSDFACTRKRHLIEWRIEFQDQPGSAANDRCLRAFAMPTEAQPKLVSWSCPWLPIFNSSGLHLRLAPCSQNGMRIDFVSLDAWCEELLSSSTHSHH